jgi:uncharacterized protein (TIGR03085 family)
VTSIAAHERALLCALAQQLGPDAPTLCGDWTVKELVVHLLLREGHPAAVGIVVPPLRALLDRATAKTGSQDFNDLVERLRHGPPVWSPFALPRVGALANLLEFYVHHEDIRRAQSSWEPRALPVRTEDGIWRALRHAGRGLVLKAPVGVVGERSDTGARATLKKGDGEVVVRGLPSEVTMFAYGRQPHARVELLGEDADVAALHEASLGI